MSFPVKHGMSGTTEYKAWQGMIRRCYEKSNDSYKWYGARGIVVCDRWRNSFEAFYADMGNKPKATMSLDRIDSNGNYEPSNCRWATATVQAANKREQGISITNTSGYKGVSYDKTRNKYKAYVTIGGLSVYIGRYGTAQEARAAVVEAESPPQ